MQLGIFIYFFYIYKNRNLIYFIRIIIRIIPYFDKSYTHEGRNCDLDLSVQWFQPLARRMKLTINS